MTGINLEDLHGSIETMRAPGPEGRIVLFASAHPGEGKSTVLAALADRLAADKERRILVIDGGDAHRLVDHFAGCQEIEFKQLRGDLARIRQNTPQARFEPGLCVSAIETGKHSSTESIIDQDMADLLRVSFDHVLIELPSVVAAPSTVMSARHFDGVILVIEACRTRWPVAQHVCEQFERVGVKILGAVLNKRRHFGLKRSYQSL